MKNKRKIKRTFLKHKKEIGDINLGRVLSEISYHHYSLDILHFEASIGAEAIYNIFKNLDLGKLKAETEK
jgi:hypothetical protein